MKITIRAKLFLITIVPLITLLLFSIETLTQNKEFLKLNSKQIEYSQDTRLLSNLIFEMQRERGLFTAYLSKIDSEHFKEELQTQLKESDKQLQLFFQAIKTNKFSHSAPEIYSLLQNAHSSLGDIKIIRESAFKNGIDTQSIFSYYTDVNNNLLEYIKTLKIRSTQESIDTSIYAIQKLLILQEYAGQERALVESITYKLTVSPNDLKHYATLNFIQNREINNLYYIFAKTQYKEKFKALNKKYNRSFLTKARKTISSYEEKKAIGTKIFQLIGFGGMIQLHKQYLLTKDKQVFERLTELKKQFDIEIQRYLRIIPKRSVEFNTLISLQKHFDGLFKSPNKQLNINTILSLYKYIEQQHLRISPTQWFEVTSSRLSDIHALTDDIFNSMIHIMKKNQVELNRAFSIKMTLTAIVIVLLLLGAYLLSNRIVASIKNLQHGLDEFFEFLNFNQSSVSKIVVHSNDEIHDMAEQVNTQILTTQTNIEDDLDFIKEATQIVQMMKEGDFSEKLYFEPNNPSLAQLKDVLNELISIITDKVKEQTDALESLNSSLENQVFHQTNELTKQVEELTLARDTAIKAEIAKDEFLANMSHEIRTPLNAILGFVTILRKRVTEEKSLQYLGIIDNSGKSLLTIINDILDFSKIQSGKFTISTYPIEPLTEFSNTTLLFASKAYEKNIIYSVYIDPNLPKSIEIDLVRVNQILSNVLSNAIKFTPDDGEIKVKIIIKDEKLLMSVQDSGIGIAKEHQSKIFSAFEQADGSTTRKYGGTGLGLSISSKLATLMEGTLTLKSEENRGSIFTLTLPIKVLDSSPLMLIDTQKINNYTFAILNSSHNSPSQSMLIKKYLQDFGIENLLEIDEYQESGYDVLFFIPDDDYNEDVVMSSKPAIAMLRTSAIKLANLPHIEALYAPFVPTAIVEAINDIGLQNIRAETLVTQEEESDEVQYNGNILVAEDNKTNQMLIGLILDDYGLEYEIANNGLEAVTMFKESKYDLVLMDENMPELNGIGAMEQIKEYEKKSALILTPIVALTASVLDTDKEMFLNAGMDGFVGKPIDTDELEVVFNKYLQKA